MSDVTLKILGVYRPHISSDTWKEQWAITGDNEQTQAHFAALVIIEAIVEGLDGAFQMIKFGQMDSKFPTDPDHMQVGYDEALLSADGEVVVDRRIDCVYGTGPLRFAVYLHLYDSARPLLWQAGELFCPSVQDVPTRLARLVPYRACS